MLARRALAQAGFDSVQVEAQATQIQTSLLLNPQTQKIKQPLHLQKNLTPSWGRCSCCDLTLMLTVLVLKFFKKMVSYLNLSGNQIGAIMAKYIFGSPQNAGTLPENAALCKSIVSTDLVTKIAESYGATMFNVLTGFKFIAEKIQEFEENTITLT